MSQDIASIVRLATWMGGALAGAKTVFEPFNTRALGIALPDAVVEASGVRGALAQLNASADLLGDLVEELSSRAEADDQVGLVAAFTAFGLTLGDYFRSLGDLESALKTAITPATIPNATERTAAEAAVDNLARDLADVLLAQTMSSTRPEIGIALYFLGLFDWRLVPKDLANPASRQFVLKKLRLDRLKDLVANPVTHFKAAFGWGTDAFDPTPFFELYRDFLYDEADVEQGAIGSDPFLRHGSRTIRRISASPPAGLSIEWARKVATNATGRVELSEDWGIEISSGISFDAGTVATIRPMADVTLEPVAGTVQGDLVIAFDRNPASRPFDIVGGNELLRLSAENCRLALGVEARWNPQTEKAGISPVAKLQVEGGNLEIGSRDADGFLARLLGQADIAGRFDLGLFFSPENGLQVTGGGGVEIALPLHQSLGPLEIQTLFIALGISGNGALELETSVGLKAELGPLVAVVERVGAELELRFVDDASADFGPFDLSLGFKPPNGVGLSIDAGAVKGGGYLFIDPDRGEYAGTLELSILEFVTVTAVGVITTKMPDGSKGFAFIAIISAEFNPGFQLGFGFTLLGVGGLVGLNRSMNLDALAKGVQSGGIDSILFPKDVVANAPRIISDLRAFFPPEQDTFLIGPMAKIGWGTPTLISLSLGIILEIPGNLAIVGKLTVAIPDERAALIIIRVVFTGAIEFDKKRLWFVATLYESRVIYLPLDGGLGVLAAFGKDSAFVVSAGGFHPSYNPPALPFPVIGRIAINILNTPVARIRVDAYFAITSNTVQFGARAELYFGIKIAKVEGHLGFDALFQFSPFYFIISISASLSVKLFGAGLFSIRFKGSLEGTSPWHVEGTGRIKLLFWKVSVDFSHTWGDKEDTSLPPISVMPLLVAELEKAENWTAKLENANKLLVSLRTVDSTADPGDDLVLHPVGSLAIVQRAVPLGLTLDKVGNQKPDDADHFTLDAATGGIEKRGTLNESFAIAQFKDLNDDAKLSTSDFENEEAGLELAITGEQTRTSFVTKRIARYEQIIIDNQFKRAIARFVTLISGFFTHFLGNNAVARSAVSFKSRDQKHLFDEKVTVSPNAYVVVSQVDNGALDGVPVSFASRASAQEFMARETARDPAFAQQAHIVRPHEMKEAA